MTAIFSTWRNEPEFPIEDYDLSMLEKAIGKTNLTERHKEVIQLRFFLGMSFREIGKRYKVGPYRANQIAHRAVRLLRSPWNIGRIKSAVPEWFNYKRKT